MASAPARIRRLAAMARNTDVPTDAGKIATLEEMVENLKAQVATLFAENTELKAELNEVNTALAEFEGDTTDPTEPDPAMQDA